MPIDMYQLVSIVPFNDTGAMSRSSMTVADSDPGEMPDFQSMTRKYASCACVGKMY